MRCKSIIMSMLINRMNSKLVFLLIARNYFSSNFRKIIHSVTYDLIIMLVLYLGFRIWVLGFDQRRTLSLLQ